jgi:subtilisin family serine protease
MTDKRVRGRLLGVVATVFATVLVLPVASEGQNAPPARPAEALAGPIVTLLTGDQVQLGGPRGAQARPARGREDISFTTWTDERGHVHVLPSDASAKVARGQFDPLLFDVTALVEAGYDDASRPDLPLIVDYPGATPRMAGAKVGHELPSLSAVAVHAERGSGFWATGRLADRIWLDAPVHATLDRSVPQIGAPEAWAAGYTGAGTTVAVLDSGIDASHPDLAGAVVGERDFTGGTSGTDDFAGHGTHVASTITGAGKYRGVAPDAVLLNGKVLDDFGFGQMSWVISGMEWAAASGADVVNMSLGSDSPSDGQDPVSQAVNELTEQTGTLFVVAAGNQGRRGWTVGSPAAAERALTVGAVDRDDTLADFSTTGPREGDSGIKPDVTAPGVGIVAAKAKNGVLGDPVEGDDSHVAMSGTSMASPHVAGAAAILAGEHPDWTPEQIKVALMNTAVPSDGATVFQQGAGRIDVGSAVSAKVTAGPGSLSFGLAQWPHDDDQAVTKTVAYTNAGTTPITLDLAVEVPNAPAGMFVVTPNQVTVPAGGQATATVTADPKAGSTDGRYAGTLTATGAGLTLRTLMAVEREVESYDVSMTFLDEQGQPTNDFFALLLATERDWGSNPWDPSGTVHLRLPRGEYFLTGDIGGDHATFLSEPGITVDRNLDLTLDARQGKPLEFTLDQPNATVGVAMFGGTMALSAGRTGGGHQQTPDASQWRMLPSTTSSDKYRFDVEAELAEPDGDGQSPDFEGSPYLYDLAWSAQGGIPANLHRTYTDRQLAEVHGTYAQSTPGTTGVRDDMVANQLPFTLKEFYTPNTPVYPRFYELTDPTRYDYINFADTVRPRVYPRGRITQERYNTGVFSPAFPFHEDFPNYLMSGRSENQLGFNLGVADQDPGRMGVFSYLGEGHMELLHDGTVIGESPYPSGNGFFEVGPEDATYTVRSFADRSARSRLSTQVSSEWTFRSKNVPGFVPEPLPMLAVRFAPKLDVHNAAPAGRKFHFPVYVQRGGSNTPIALSGAPKVEVSYDDGVTWQKVRLTRDHDQWQAEVNHPKGAKFVSLRAGVADKQGGSVKHTIIRAYALT